MIPSRIGRIFILFALLMASAASAFGQKSDRGSPGDETVSFGRQIRPILAKNCLSCHGPDESAREAELRLDDRANAIKLGAITPGKPGESTLVERIETADEDLIMPPPSSGESLTDEEKATIKSWIKQGAKYENHWAFEVPRKHQLPKIKKTDWPLSPIDFFVLHKIEEKGLTPSNVADKLTWIRRVALDLTGLPPNRKLVDSFLNDHSVTAHETVVDRLLDSKAYGEHWARMWLDLARYADTRGYEKDRHRDIWRYRDWVIDALNSDMPFDQFTRDQLAGDLLANRTTNQVLATAFHRNTMTNEEGGTDNEEFRVAAVKDRVDTTIQVWMGLTMGCAKCHSHKYDPIALKDYYSFYAFFNQTQDNDTEGPFWPTPTTTQTKKIDQLQKQIENNSKTLSNETRKFQLEFDDWKKQFASKPLWQPLSLKEYQSKQSVQLTQNKDGLIVASGKRPNKDTWTLTFDISDWSNATSLRIDHFPKSFGGGDWPDANIAIQEIQAEWVDEQGKRHKLPLQNPRASFSQKGWEVAKAIDGKLNVGWALSPNFEQQQVAVFDFPKPLSGSKLVLHLVQEYGQSLLLARAKFSVSQRPVNWNLATTKDELKSIFVREVYPITRRAYQQNIDLQKQLAAIRQKIPKTPVMLELEKNRKRVTRIHQRGNFLEQTETVEPKVLELFGKLDPKSPRNRLGVADWLTSDSNPLTARVMVNRIWARLFGIGIVETEEDFGTQGLLPTHPKLLDWLAVDFRENNWSMKKLIKRIVLSQTYRQSSRATDQQLKLDPRNRWLSRGPRFRLSAEMVRDQALAAAGLLSRKIGGPSVMPPQPNGIWKSTYNGQSWKNATGPDRYRRAIYTYLKRTSPYPAMQTFDAGSGEVCQIRRVRTNTPLQALVVLNDQAYFEAAGGLAERMKESSTEISQQLKHGFRRLLVRPPTDKELNRLVKLYQSLNLTEVQERQVLDGAGLKDGDAKLVLVANVLLNLDEAFSKP